MTESRPRSALLIHGGWDGHQPADCSAAVADGLRAAGWQVRVEQDLELFADADLMGSIALAIPMWTMGTISKEASQGLRTAVRAGCGLGGWHGGLGDAFRNDTEYQFMTGGQFVCHPGNIIDYTVRIRDLAHPITAALGDFQIRSEQYYMHVDPGLHVLASTVFSGLHGDAPWIRGVEMPVAWTKPYGAGRVFYSALGHGVEDLRHPQAFSLLINGLRWAGRDLP